MVYESDFYTTRRPYRTTPNYSSYTVSTVVPSRQIRILPGIGKYDPYYYYSYPYYPYYPHNYPYYNKLWRDLYWSHLYPQYPVHVWSKMFDDETRSIRAQSSALLKRIHAPVPRLERAYTPIVEKYLPVTTVSRYSYHPETTWPARVTSDDFVYKMLTPIRNVKNDIYNISHYHSDPLVKRFAGGGLACVKYAGDKAYSRRRNLTVQDIYAMQSDTVRGDIHLLSYYIKANKDRKALEGDKVPLNPTRTSRVWTPRVKLMLEANDEIKELREQRAERLAKIHAIEDAPVSDEASARIKRATKQKEEERLAEERALAEEKKKAEEQAKKDEAARKAELARQEALAAQAAAERAAEIERKAEEARKAEQARKAEEERKAKEEAERAAKEKEEAERKAKEDAKAKEEAERKAREDAERKAKEEADRKAKEEEELRLAELARLEEIARQAEEEKEKELARQAAELADLARQEAELADQARKEAELAELAKKEAELAEAERQEKELSELDRKDREAAEAAKLEGEMVEQKKEVDEIAAAEAAVVNEEPGIKSPPPEEVVSSDPEAEADAVPVVEEPLTPDVQQAYDTASSVEELKSEGED